MRSAKSIFSTAAILRRVSSVGFLNSCSIKLIIARDKPAWAANSVMERPRCSRKARKIFATSEQTRSRDSVSDTPCSYLKFGLTADVTIVTSPGMFVKRLGMINESGTAACAGGCNCPDILLMESGDYAVIGTDITDEVRGKLLPGSGCGPGERVVQVPRRIFVVARPEIPASM